MLKLMAKSKQRTKRATELDSAYILKVLLYMILGSQWLYITNIEQNYQLPIPVGLIIGILFARHEHFKIDRKIEYSVLLVIMFVSFWLPMGIKIFI